MNRRTGGTRDHVIKRRLKTCDAAAFGGSRCRESGAENNRDGERNFCRAEHFRLPVKLRGQLEFAGTWTANIHTAKAHRRICRRVPNSLQVLARACSLLA
jgi:hypothetical protein